MEERIKYKVSFKDSSGGHHSTKTMGYEEYLHLLHTTISYLKGEVKENPYPTVNFITEQITQIYQTEE